jgi:hypothetical protein
MKLFKNTLFMVGGGNSPAIPHLRQVLCAKFAFHNN